MDSPPSRRALRWTTFAWGWLANRSSLASQATEGWRGVWDEFRNWAQLGPEAPES